MSPERSPGFEDGENTIRELKSLNKQTAAG